MSTPAARPATRAESPDEIRLAMLGFERADPVEFAPPAPSGSRGKPVPVYRPTQRPPMALLAALDDGSLRDGEWRRLRGERFVIGRADGDLTLPFDSRLSTRHAEIARRPDGDGFAWTLSDLGSTNGTFVRVSTAKLIHGKEFLVGRTVYRFDDAPGGAASAGTIPDPRQTADRFAGVAADGVPHLVDLGPNAARIPIPADEVWIGSDPADCSVVPVGDPFVSPRHARVVRDERGRWHVVNNRSVNGVWVRITAPMDVTAGCVFLLGEQRFVFRVL
jgi:pSer/pThr/pTyr-binding forkhead associated (FHA) protein